MIRKIILLIVGIIFLTTGKAMALELFSPAFHQGGTIPSIYTCDGKDISPPLFWKDAPVGTKSLVLIMDDPDAPNGTWDHWLVYNIPPNVSSIAENLQTLPNGALTGKNSWNKTTYGGPCPPDKEHRYFFKIYALDITLPDKTGLNKDEVLKLMNGHILASTELIAKFKRSS